MQNWQQNYKAQEKFHKHPDLLKWSFVHSFFVLMNFLKVHFKFSPICLHLFYSPEILFYFTWHLSSISPKCSASCCHCNIELLVGHASGKQIPLLGQNMKSPGASSVTLLSNVLEAWASQPLLFFSILETCNNRDMLPGLQLFFICKNSS